jgi:predicted AAA+ superfamily ATPase
MSSGVAHRPFWLQRIEDAWRQAPIVWLTGVRRVGKTTLARQLGDVEILNCDLPSTARRVEDPELFFRTVAGPAIVFDEIHQLPDPSRLLKIAADEHPGLRVLATGSSTLAATKKFRDSLTGRKRTVHLLPVLVRELEAFGVSDLRRRLFHGGLPEALLASRKPVELFTEWLDSYFARDVQELFSVAKRREFLTLVELVLRRSGGELEVTGLSRQVEISRPTVTRYLDILETTHLAHFLRPYHGGGRQELVHRPKVYGFDTGFVSFARGWMELRDEDCGLLWEHLVLETLLSEIPARDVYYWRDKQRREVDFVLSRGNGRVDAIECKWRPDRFSPRSFTAFRELHPVGRDFVLSPGAGEPRLERRGERIVVVTDLTHWSNGAATRLADEVT